LSLRVGILSDIHGNVWALEAVLEHAKNHGVDQLVNLGDTLYGPLKPRATYDRLLHENIAITIQGNQDRTIFEAGALDLARSSTLAYVIRDLGEEPIHWMAQLPKSAILESDVFLCHGAPRGDTIYLLEDVLDGYAAVRSDAAIKELLTSVHQPVVVCGHSHVPRVVMLAHGQLVVNPGSVGLPAFDDVQPVRHFMETFAPHAAYAILEKSTRGWDVSLQRVAYNHGAAAELARSLGRDDWAQGIATGRMM